jgi:NAD(P)-dependent dehydrogenase (short-subunit alcohol dehydrogenase family)
VLVNNVGVAPPRPQGFLEVTDDMWATTWNLNVMAAVRATRAALPVMLAGGGGAIVNTGSVNHRLADPLVVDYSAAKAALTSFAKSLSKEFGASGIRVNTVAPGPVATDLWLGDHGVAATVSAARGLTPEQVEAGAKAGMVTGRFTRPEEVADLVVLLAGDRLGNVTGAEYVIDGGMITTL